ncbi:hypothetical protein TL16_g05244 [Triparma laevis f. inornata]|uniref:Uncharacterized protein n=1 Tax=Triparma laevis f. inornata TaxID=1714386 RepID=A0A9W7E680_9STRA|nr:hypothetical protein TL16_g05244 [Triparma laevis f. inornata]
MQSKYVAPTKSGLPPEEADSGAVTVATAASLDRNELCAAIVDMHSQLHHSAVLAAKLKEESRILQRMINDKKTTKDIALGWQTLTFDPSRLEIREKS